MHRRELLTFLVGGLSSLVGSAQPARPAHAQAPAPGAPSPPVTLLEFEPLARQRLSRMAYDYVSHGAADQVTLQRNRTAFDAIRLKPRVLIDVSALDTRLKLFGQPLEFPILLAPAGGLRLVHQAGETEAARGAHASGAAMVISTNSSVPLEDIAKAAPARFWFQLYARRDRAATRDLVQRAEAAGCSALCITVDTPVIPMRDHLKRPGMGLTPPPGKPGPGGRVSPIYADLFAPTVTWETIAWIRSFAKTPVLLKGVLAPEDARLAADHGVAGVVVSNHGGRNLDTTPATIEALPAVVAAVGDRMTVLLDSGVRRGTDVVKALALGAQAVLIGRPYLWGLAVDGAAGVQRVVEILRTELEAAMALCGAPSLDKITRQLLWPPP